MAASRLSLRHLRRFTTTTGDAATTVLESTKISASKAKSILRKQHDPDKALEIYSNVSNHSASPVSSRYAQELTVRRLAKCNRFSDIEALIESHKDDPRIKEEPFYSTLIRSYGRASMLDHAVKAFEEMGRHETPRTAVSFNALLTACLNSQNFEKVPQLFDEMPQRYSTIVPDRVSYGILIKSYCDAGSPEKAIEIMREMEGKRNMEVTTIAFTTILGSLYKNGKVELAESLWNEAGNYLEMEREEESNTSNSNNISSTKTKLSNFFWHGGSVYDAWFSCASNQVAQVLLTLPYSFSQLGMMSGILFQLFYGLMGSWTAYLISVLYVEYRTRKEREKFDFRNHVIQWFEVLDGLLGKHWRNIGLIFNCTFLLFGSVIQLIACASNIYYINDKLDKRTWTYIFGACCATTVFIPSFHNYRIWSFLGLAMTTYTSWYLTIASLLHGQAEDVKHSGPTTMVLYFTGATNILYTFGGHAVTVEIMHAMWKPQKFKAIYLLATIYVLTLTLPSATAVYWAFGDQLLTHSNALSLLPKSGFRDTAVILMLIHQFITFGFASTPLYFVWEKLIGVHETKSMFKRAMARLPVVLPIWFLAIIFPFFGPINSAVGSLLVSFTVYIIPALAHMLTFAPAPSRENAVERPPRVLGGWMGTYCINIFVVVWVFVVGFGFGGWASMVNFVRQIDTFGLFTKCYQCPPRKP